MNKGKRGYLVQNVMFIILNITFGVAMLIYVTSSLSSKYIQEQSLAKQIALQIDEARPNMTLSINIEKAYEVIGKKASVSQKEKIISIGGNVVRVNLGSANGYGVSYFTEAKISYKFVEERFLWIKIEQ